MRYTLRVAAAALALLVPAARAAACSVASSYRVPTNLELVERAEMIVLGTAEAHAPGTEPHDTGEIIVRPVALLRGAALPDQVRVHGYLSDDAHMVAASNPRDLYNPNPGALMGGCTRYIYRRGMLLLLFLERDDEGRLRLATHAFARSAEDVPSAEAPWVKAVRLYAEIAALPAAERRAALVARRDALRSASDDPDSALLADDIDRQINRRRIPNRD